MSGIEIQSNRKSPSRWWVVVLAACVIVAGCGKKLTEQEYIERAKQQQDQGDLRASVIELKNALRLNPNSVEGRWLLGNIYLDLHDGASAEKELRKARELGIDEKSVTIPLGRVLLLQRKYKEVLEEIQPDTATSTQDKARILALRGEAKLGLGKLDEGCELFQQAKDIDANNGSTYRGLARCAVARRDMDTAKTQLETALKLNDKDAETWVMLGDIEAFRNERKAAEEAYQAARKADPKNISSYIGLASLDVAEGDLEKAATEIQAAGKIAPGNLQVNYMQAFVEFRQQKYQEARDKLQKILGAAPKHMPSLLLSGMVGYALGSYEEAYKNVSAFLSQAPNNVFATKLLAAVNLKLNRPVDALKNISPLLATSSDDALLLALAGEAYMQRGEYAKAGDYLEKAAAIDTQNAALRTQLGVSRLAIGETQQAVADLERAAAIEPGQVADSLLVVTHLRSGAYDKALAAAQAWQKNQPKNPLAYNLEGGAYLGKKDVANARKSFEQALAVQPAFLPAAENLARLDLADKNMDAARKRFEDVLSKDKANVSAMIDLANLSAMAGKEAEYVSWLEKATKADPSAIPPYRLLTRYYLQKQDGAKALATAKQARSSNLQDIEALDLLAATQVALGNKADALASYESLVNMAPNMPETYVKLASVQALNGDAQSAKNSLKKALALKPDYRDAQAALVAVDMQAGHYDQAQATAQRIEKQDPALGAKLEGDILMARKQYAAAAQAYDRALTQGKTSLLALDAHRAWSLAGKADKADEVLSNWLKKNPNDTTARAYLGQSYAQAGRYKQAADQYQMVLEKNPDDVAVLNNLAWAYHAQKDPRALNTAEKAYRMSPENPVVLDTYGWMLVQQSKASQAVDVLQKAASKAAKHPEINYHLAVALYKTGDMAGARKMLENLLTSSKGFSQEREARALLAEMQKQ